MSNYRSIPNRNTRSYDTVPIHDPRPLQSGGQFGWYQVISHPFKGNGTDTYEPGEDWQEPRVASVWALPVPYLDSTLVTRWSASSVDADGGTYDGSDASDPQVLTTHGVDIELQQVFLGPPDGSIDYKPWDGAPMPGQVIRASSGPLGLMADGSAHAVISGVVSEDSGIQFCAVETGGAASITGQFPFTPLGDETYVDGDTVVCAFIDNEYRALGGTCTEAEE